MLLAGLDFDRLMLGDGLWVRHERVFGFDIDAFTDKNLKPDPMNKKHSSAQTDVQSIKFPFGIDTCPSSMAKWSTMNSRSASRSRARSPSPPSPR